MTSTEHYMAHMSEAVVHCTVAQCTTAVRARGLCARHYKRARKAGMPKIYGLPLEVKFWAKVEKTATCWLWGGAITTQGYGQLNRPPRGSRMLAHRLSYELAKGPIPDGLVLDHLCRVRHCVNPDHLEAVTNKENILRGVSPAARKAQQTHCDHGHEFTPENTYNKAGRRRCVTCSRQLARETYAAKRGVAS